MSMHGQWMALRSLTSDQSVKNQKLKAGTFKRILGFAAPYKKYLIIFMITVVIDAFLVVAIGFASGADAWCYKLKIRGELAA